MYDTVIATTAVTRPDLHSKTFPGYLEFIEGLRVKWVFTVDVILDQSLDETVKYLQALKSDSIDIEILKTATGGSKKSFYSSAQHLSNFVNSFKTRYGILWLEDDWLYLKQKKLLDILHTVEFQSRDYLQLIERKDGEVLSFNPGLWGHTLFEEACYTGLLQSYSPKNSNPENACVYPTPEKRKLIEHVYKFPNFKDVGRDWQVDKKIKRTFNIKE